MTTAEHLTAAREDLVAEQTKLTIATGEIFKRTRGRTPADLSRVENSELQTWIRRFKRADGRVNRLNAWIRDLEVHGED